MPLKPEKGITVLKSAAGVLTDFIAAENDIDRVFSAADTDSSGSRFRLMYITSSIALPAIGTLSKVRSVSNNGLLVRATSKDDIGLRRRSHHRPSCPRP